MAAVVLNNKADTSLYAPAAPGPGEQMLFLQWANASPDPITLDQAWDPRGGRAGWLLFLSTLPPDSALKTVEANCRAALPPGAPTVTGLAWIALAADWSVATANVLSLAAATGADRTVELDFTAPGPSQFPDVPIPAATPVVAVVDGAGALQGANIIYPGLAAFDGQPAAQPPYGLGVSLPLTGEGVGCLRFQGLISGPNQGGGLSVVKDIYTASLDPLNAYDEARTYLVLTGASVTLSRVNPTGGPFAVQEGLN